jgi:hypothetical protein
MNEIIGIGAQKCASSWLYEVLNAHNETYMSSKKEVDFFSYYYDKGYEWYHRHFDTNLDLISGEISPSYFYNKDVPRRVKAYNPNIKILLCLRDPIKRMYSNHLHEVRAGNISGDNIIFENALVNNPLYLEQSLYIKHIDEWLKYFERNQILVVFQEDINRDPTSVYKKVCSFLNISIDESFSGDFYVNDSTIKNNLVLGYIFETGGKALRCMGLKGIVDGVKRNGFVSRLYKGSKTHLKDIVPPPRPETETELRSILSAYDSELKNVLGISRLPWD